VARNKAHAVVNDLAVEVAESELAKVQSPPALIPSRDISTPIPARDDKGSIDAGHVKEVNLSELPNLRLRADLTISTIGITA
jgi:hypothetical protein